ncbi:MAG: hypothetical protein WCS18_11535 [Sphaerochaetaceae bacterium]
MRGMFAMMRMQRELRRRFGKDDYGMLLATLLDGADYFSGKESRNFRTITISFDGGYPTTLDFVTRKESHGE